MIKIENVNVMNFDGALRGMRNPMGSHAKADTRFDHDWPIEGPKDLELAQRLVLAGTDHSKFMRQIFVTMDITAPLYWWKEMDTYKVATVANSESTMHKLASTPITRDCFSFDTELNGLPLQATYNDKVQVRLEDHINGCITDCENLRRKYLETNDVSYWRALIQFLPESWNQMRTWTADYAVLRNIYFARKLHKLVEWHVFCRVIENLPYGQELICIQKSNAGAQDRGSGLWQPGDKE